MKNRKFLGLSPALMLEDLKLFWFGPALTLLLYAMANIVPLLRPFEKRTIIEQNLTHLGFVQMGFVVAIPFFASLILLEYYHKSGKSLVLHSQPYSRSKLFNTQVVTGWLMFIVPVVLVAIVYLIAMKGVVSSEAMEVTLQNQRVGEILYESRLAEVYTAKAVLKWLFINVSFMTFFYGIFTLMGAITGNVVLHVIMSIVGFFIIPALAFIISIYQETFLPNYGGYGPFMSWLINETNPLIAGVGCSFTVYSNLQILAYLLVGIAFVFLAKLCVLWVKLEKTGSGVLFKPIEEVITILACIFGMTGCGFLFLLLFNEQSMLMFYLGSAVGIVVTFFLVKLIIHRSAKIFTKENLKVLIVVVLIAVIFSLIFIYDIFGYGSRLANVEKVEAVRLDNLFSSYSMYYGNKNYDDFCEKAGLEPGETLSDDPVTIAKIFVLQKYIVENDLYRPGVFNSVTWDYGDYVDDNGIHYYWGYDQWNQYNDSDYMVDTLNVEFIMKNGTKYVRAITFKADKKVRDMIDDILGYIGYEPIVQEIDGQTRKTYWESYDDIKYYYEYELPADYASVPYEEYVNSLETM